MCTDTSKHENGNIFCLLFTEIFIGSHLLVFSFWDLGISNCHRKLKTLEGNILHKIICQA